MYIQRFRRNQFITVTALLFPILAFQNCSPSHNMTQANLSSGIPADPTDPNPVTTTTMPPSQPQAKTYFSCNQSTAGTTSAVRLSRREYKNTMQDLLRLINSSVYDATLDGLVNALPLDEERRVENTTLVDLTHIQGYLEVAYYVGNRVASSSTFLATVPGATSSCLTAATPTASCINGTIQGFGSRVFRRPLSSSEISFYEGIYNSSNFSGKTNKLIALFASLLQSPDFLYRIYDTGAAGSLANTRILTDYEYASKLSYFLNGTMPDEQLFAAAAAGTLRNSATLESEVNRLLAKTQARAAVLRFFTEWLDLGNYEGFAGFPANVLQGVSITGLPEAMTKEVEDLILHIVFTRQGNFSDLMTSREAFVTNAGLASIYGVAVGSATTPMTLSSNRAGILSRSAFLARKARQGTSSTTRGLAVLEDILCEHVNPPPPNAPAQVSPLQPGEFYTSRDRIHQLTIQSSSGVTASACISCHTRMNYLGYTYELFDSIGRVRPNAMETVYGANGTMNLPINTTSETFEINNSRIALNNHLELQNAIATSDKAQMCLTKKLFQYMNKREPAAADNCFMNETLETAYGTTAQGSLLEVLKRTVKSERFRYWKHQ